MVRNVTFPENYALLNDETSINDSTEKRDSGLTSPAEAGSDSDIVIYDGNCIFCTRQVQRLSRWDRNNRLAYVSLHDPYVAENFPDLSHDQLMEQMFLVTTDGQRLGGADAIRYLSRKLPLLWLLAPLLHIPFSMPLWRWLYGVVARQRYRLAGKREDCGDGSCEVHFKK